MIEELISTPNGGNDEVFASVVFPIADLRAFFCPELQVVDKPFRERNSQAYLRRFGPGKYRSLQRDVYLHRYSNSRTLTIQKDFPPALAADENWFISAKRFLHIPDAPVQPRLFADGFISARLEISLVFPKSAIKESVVQFVRHQLSLPVELRLSRAGKRSPERQKVMLGDVSGHFRNAFLAATTAEPARRQAREDPKSQASHLLRTAEGALFCLEPLILLTMPTSHSTAPGLQLRFGVVRTGTNSFQLLSLYPHSDSDMLLIRQARRAFTRLHAEGRAILKLTEQWSSLPPTTRPPQKLVEKLGALADRLSDASAILTDRKGAAIPLLGEVGPTLAAAVEQLGGWLDQVHPDAGRSQRRLAKQLLRAVPSRSTVEVKMGDIFSNIQNSTIVNKSFVRDAFNKVRSGIDEETAQILLKVAEAVAQSHNGEAGEILDQFNEELVRQEPRKSLLKRSWDALLQVLPALGDIAGAATAVAKLFM